MSAATPAADPGGWTGDGDRSGVGRLGGPERRGGRRGTAVAPAGPSATDWPGVPDPDALRAQLADWLGQYANAGTRRTYGYALGLPVSWVDAIGGRSVHTARGTPPPAPRGPLHHLAWFRWCAHRALDPRAATGRDVKAWLHALDAAGASRRTRQRMLSTLSALYGHLTETGAVAANPAALHRGRLGLSSTARDASPTVRLTAGQLRALLLAAGGLPHGRDLRLHRLYATRAVAFVALLTLGLRISELVGLDRGDLAAAAATRSCACWARAGTTGRSTSPTSWPRPWPPTSPNATGPPGTPRPPRGAARSPAGRR